MTKQITRIQREWVEPAPEQALDTPTESVAGVNPPPLVIEEPVRTEWLTFAQWAQTMQALQQRQMQLLNEVDTRLARVERGATWDTERVTWWMLWGILMLIMGGALTILIVLILMGRAPF